jgi:hypothetical protein
MTGGDAFAIAGVQSTEGWGWGWGRAFSDTSSLHPPSPPTSHLMHGASLPASARVVDTQPVQWANEGKTNTLHILFSGQMKEPAHTHVPGSPQP